MFQSLVDQGSLWVPRGLLKVLGNSSSSVCILGFFFVCIEVAMPGPPGCWPLAQRAR